MITSFEKLKQQLAEMHDRHCFFICWSAW